MIETKDITNMVKHILRRDKGIADTNIMHPSREWFTGLGIATVIVFVGSWFCYYLYSVHTTKMQEEVTIVEQAVPYQAATVKSAIELFETKQKKYNEIISNGDTSTVNEIPPVSTSTDISVVPEEVRDIPEVIVDPAPIFEDDGTPVEAVLAP
jgi:hypothetical protein